MILGCLIVGLACGAVAALSVILSGLGLWLALLAYSAIGAMGLCLAAGIGIALQKPDRKDAVAGLA